MVFDGLTCFLQIQTHKRYIDLMPENCRDKTCPVIFYRINKTRFVSLCIGGNHGIILEYSV